MGELESLFRNWLGHDVRVSGEMTRDGQTLTLTLRAGADPVDPVTGPTSDPGALIKKAAEELYGATQPERYARWLRGANRNDDAANIYRRLSITGTPRQRARALVGWSGVLGDNPAGSIQKAQEALRLDPENPSAWASLSDNQMELGLWEATLKSARRAVQLFAGPRRADFAPWYVHLHSADQQGNIANVLDQVLVEAKVSEAAGDPAPAASETLASTRTWSSTLAMFPCWSAECRCTYQGAKSARRGPAKSCTARRADFRVASQSPSSIWLSDRDAQAEGFSGSSRKAS